MITLLLFLATTLLVPADGRGSIGDALAEARQLRAAGDTSEIVIRLAPGTYYEELTIDVPHLTLVSDSAKVSWYYGHGYQYASMHGVPNYGGSRTRLWNASVLVTAPYFRAEGITFENSFNLYVSPLEAQDTLVDLFDAAAEMGWSEKERPKRAMPARPRVPYDTSVQARMYIERASALSFGPEAKHCHLRHCRVYGRQDAFYGAVGASVWMEECTLGGSVDYIFGGLTLLCDRCTLVAMTGSEPNEKCYIAAARGYAPTGERLLAEAVPPSREQLDSIPRDEYVQLGMLFYDCLVRHADSTELASPGRQPVWLARPWRWWGQTVFSGVREAAPGTLRAEGDRWSLGLTKGHPAPFSYELPLRENLRKEWLKAIFSEE